MQNAFLTLYTLYHNLVLLFADIEFICSSGATALGQSRLTQSFNQQVLRCWTGPAALACLLSAVGLFKVATGDGQPTPWITASLFCWVHGVPGQDREGSWSPGEVVVSDKEDDEEERVESPASFRGCSWRMDSWEDREQGQDDPAWPEEHRHQRDLLGPCLRVDLWQPCCW